MAEQMLHAPNIDSTAHHVGRAFRAKIAQAKVLHVRFVGAAIAPEHGADALPRLLADESSALTP
jgi:hypothetical protein